MWLIKEGISGPSSSKGYGWGINYAILDVCYTVDQRLLVFMLQYSIMDNQDIIKSTLSNTRDKLIPSMVGGEIYLVTLNNSSILLRSFNCGITYCYLNDYGTNSTREVSKYDCLNSYIEFSILLSVNDPFKEITLIIMFILNFTEDSLYNSGVINVTFIIPPLISPPSNLDQSTYLPVLLLTTLLFIVLIKTMKR